MLVQSVGAASKRAKNTKSAGQFDMARLQSALSIPKGGNVPLTSWTLPQIFNARDLQMRGQFLQPARMAESMRTDDAIFPAFENRLAPSACIPVEVVPAKGARGASIAIEGDALFGQAGLGITPDTIASIHASLANHEVAFAQVVWTPREDGSRMDAKLESWPIEYVRWDLQRKIYLTRVDPDSVTDQEIEQNAALGFAGAYEIPINHADGRWILFKKFEIEPHKHGAILAASLVWARHAYGVRDWAKGSVAHGSAKAVVAMPQGIPLENADGSPTPEAKALIELAQAIVSSDAPAGILPYGATLQWITNNSTAWQVFAELVLNAEKAAARIYLGTDGTLGSQGGAPGVNIQALFGVAETKVEGDLRCIERGIFEGMIVPWTAINFGDSTLAPMRRYCTPDADADADAASTATRRTAFFADIAAARVAGIPVTQVFVDATAKAHRLKPEDMGIVMPAAPAAPLDAPAAVPGPDQGSDVPQ